MLLGLAFAPSVYLMLIIYGKDKYEREPKRILFVAFLLGCISIIPAGIIELLLKKPLDFEFLGLGNFAISAFFGVALIEEVCKFLMLRLHAYRLKDFNEPFDGIVYSVFVSLGFATVENVLYVLTSDGQGLSVAILRMFTAVPAHYAFGVIMGYYVGKAKFDPSKKAQYLFMALFYAAFMHGAYDFFILQNLYPALGIFTIGVLLMGLRISKRSIEELQADSVFRFQTRLDPISAPKESSDTPVN
ncbi:MAG: PrsW family glutamic-type intramembrane protease [Chitinophagales bacterium]